MDVDILDIGKSVEEEVVNVVFDNIDLGLEIRVNAKSPSEHTFSIRDVNPIAIVELGEVNFCLTFRLATGDFILDAFNKEDGREVTIATNVNITQWYEDNSIKSCWLNGKQLFVDVSLKELFAPVLEALFAEDGPIMWTLSRIITQNILDYPTEVFWDEVLGMMGIHDLGEYFDLLEIEEIDFAPAPRIMFR